MIIDKDNPNIISKENTELFEYIKEICSVINYMEGYYKENNKIWTCRSIFGCDFYEIPFISSNLLANFSINKNKVICFSPDSREYAFIFDADEIHTYEDVDRLYGLMGCLNGSRCISVCNRSSVDTISKNVKIEDKQKCNCNEVLLDELLEHDENTAIEIQFVDKNMEVVIYETHHNENGGHNDSRYIIKTNYCPMCGKELK